MENHRRSDGQGDSEGGELHFHHHEYRQGWNLRPDDYQRRRIADDDTRTGEGVASLLHIEGAQAQRPVYADNSCRGVAWTGIFGSSMGEG